MGWELPDLVQTLENAQGGPLRPALSWSQSCRDPLNQAGCRGAGRQSVACRAVAREGPT